MKLDARALLQIVEILRTGLMEGCDISQELRDLDLEDDGTGSLTLSQAYTDRKTDKV